MVKAGYKQTEVGVIPEDWEILSMGDISKVNQGLQIAIEKRKSSQAAKAKPYITIQSLGLKEPEEFIEDYSASVCCIEEDILMTRTGNTGIVVTGVNGVFHNNFFKIKFNKSILDPLYYVYFLRSRDSQKRILDKAGTSTIPDLNHGDFYSLPIVLPSKKEQTAIATALSDVDALITSLTDLIDKKRQIKTATMQQLLTGKQRLAGFSEGKCMKQTELGEIPEDWEITQLGKLGYFSKGRGIKKDDAQSGEFPCIRYGEIYTYHNDIIRDFNSHISEKVAKTSYKLKTNSLLFAGSGETKEEIGKCVAFIGDQEVYAGGDIVIQQITKGVVSFLGYLLNTPLVVKQKANRGQGDAVVHISSQALSNVLIAFPPEPEQQAIAQVLSDMDDDINALETRLAKTKAIKQGMMQELLTGKTRLV